MEKPIPSFYISELEETEGGQTIRFGGFDAGPVFTTAMAAQRFIRALGLQDTFKEIKLNEQEARTRANSNEIVVLDPIGVNDAVYWQADAEVILRALEEGETEVEYQKRVCRGE